MVAHRVGMALLGTLAWTGGPAQEPLTTRQAPSVERLFAGQQRSRESAHRGRPAPCPLEGEPRVYKLEASEALRHLIQSLARDPLALTSDGSAFLVVLARPLPCNEQLVQARLQLWDSLALTRRHAATRFFHGAAELFRRKNPTVHGLLFPQAEEAQEVQQRYRLSQTLEFSKGSPWMTSINGHGVLIFPVVSSRVSTAGWSFRTERTMVPVGKKPRRLVTDRTESSILLPGPAQPSSTLEEVLVSLGLQRVPEPEVLPEDAARTEPPPD